MFYNIFAKTKIIKMEKLKKKKRSVKNRLQQLSRDVFSHRFK